MHFWGEFPIEWLFLPKFHYLFTVPNDETIHLFLQSLPLLSILIKCTSVTANQINFFILLRFLVFCYNFVFAAGINADINTFYYGFYTLLLFETSFFSLSNILQLKVNPPLEIWQCCLFPFFLNFCCFYYYFLPHCLFFLHLYASFVFAHFSAFFL